MMNALLPATAVRSAECEVRNRSGSERRTSANESTVVLPSPTTSEGGPIRATGEELRAVFRRVPAPVAVVTATGRGEARGMTISSLTSVSLDPPLVSFNVERRAQMHALLADACGFAVHLVGVHQAELCARFAAPDRTGKEQFASVLYGFDVDGNPLLGGVLAVLRCRPRALVPAGDHAIVIGEVIEVRRHEGGAPLLYYEREYRGVGERIASAREEAAERAQFRG